MAFPSENTFCTIWWTWLPTSSLYTAAVSKTYHLVMVFPNTVLRYTVPCHDKSDTVIDGRAEILQIVCLKGCSVNKRSSIREDESIG